MKLLPKLLSVLLFLQICPLAFALDLSVGRATVQLPEGRWEVIQDEESGAAYSGDVNGTIKSAKKRVALLSEKSEVLALLSFDASSAGVTGARMSWSGGCKQNAAQSYHFDATKGNLEQRDCVKAWSEINTSPVMKNIAPKAEDLLKLKGYILPLKMHFMSHVVATNNGSFVNTTAFVNLKFANPKSDVPLPGNVIKDEIFANWALQLAEAASSSVRSFSGNLKVPTLTFSTTKGE
jgi:hypothetical protein